MSSNTFTQLHEFLNHPEVTALYANICKLQRLKLDEALFIRNLSFDGDESAMRVKLLRYEMQFYHPEIKVPWAEGESCLSKDEAATLQLRVNALCDIVRTLCRESNNESKDDCKDAQVEQSVVKRAGTLSNTAIVNDFRMEDDLNYRLNCIKLLKMCDVQYLGIRGLPAQDFLKSLEDFRRFSKISDQVLLDILPYAFQLNEKNWYRANNFVDWQSFEQRFVEDYVNWTESDDPISESDSSDSEASDTSSLDSSNASVELPRQTFNPFTPIGSCIVDRPSTPEGSPPPITRTLEELRNSLADIGLTGGSSSSISKRTNAACNDTSLKSIVAQNVDQQSSTNENLSSVRKVKPLVIKLSNIQKVSSSTGFQNIKMNDMKRFSNEKFNLAVSEAVVSEVNTPVTHTTEPNTCSSNDNDVIMSGNHNPFKSMDETSVISDTVSLVNTTVNYKLCNPNQENMQSRSLDQSKTQTFNSQVNAAINCTPTKSSTFTVNDDQIMMTSTSDYLPKSEDIVSRSLSHDQSFDDKLQNLQKIFLANEAMLSRMAQLLKSNDHFAPNDY